MKILLIVAAAVMGYLIGSLNFAIIVCKLTGKEDIRNLGSKNAGMTNMLRVYGKPAAVMTFLGDFLKGAVSILLVRLLFLLCGIEEPLWVDYMVGFTSMLGHSYPLYYGFRGGKGVMMAIGIILLLVPIPSIPTFGLFLIILACSKIVSLSSIISSASAPFWIWLYGYLTHDPNVWTKVIGACFMAGFIVIRHHSNIARLIRGEENSFRSKK